MLDTGTRVIKEETQELILGFKHKLNIGIIKNCCLMKLQPKPNVKRYRVFLVSYRGKLKTYQMA